MCCVQVRAVPDAYARFQDTMTGPPTPQALASALHSGISFFMADFEDSNTVALESLLDGIRYAYHSSNTPFLMMLSFSVIWADFLLRCCFGFMV